MSRAAMRVAVVGGGVSGLVCARVLVSAGVSVEVMDKARGPGGRVSTRRTPEGSFDHGAQYFTARDPGFQREVDSWIEAGVAAEWKGRIVSIDALGNVTPTRTQVTRYVGVPGMSAVGRHLARGLLYRPATRIETLTREGDRWRLGPGPQGEDPFDHVVLAMPPAQAVQLAPQLESTIGVVPFSSCWALMLVLPRESIVPFDGAFLPGPVLSWAARDHSKPGRSSPSAWVFHAHPVWSEQHMDTDPDSVRDMLLAAARDEAGLQIEKQAMATAHLWRYAQPREPLDRSFVLRKDLGLSASGDWCGGPRVEGAYNSGLALGHELISILRS